MKRYLPTLVFLLCLYAHEVSLAAKPPVLPAVTVRRVAVRTTGAPAAPRPAAIQTREVELSGTELLGLALRLRQFVRALQAGQPALLKFRWRGDDYKYRLAVTVSVSAVVGRMTLDDWIDFGLSVWVVVDQARHTGSWPVDIRFRMGGAEVTLNGSLVVKTL